MKSDESDYPDILSETTEMHKVDVLQCMQSTAQTMKSVKWDSEMDHSVGHGLSGVEYKKRPFFFCNQY